jgi:hypothetical protein
MVIVIVVVFVVLVIFSIHFIKQHSFLDVLAAVPMCFIAEAVAFKPYWHNQRLKHLHT